MSARGADRLAQTGLGARRTAPLAHGLPRRTILAALASCALARPAAAQVTTLDLRAAPLPVRLDDWTAQGHRREVLIRWGDRVAFDAPDWSPRAPTPQAAAAQFGWDGRLAGLVAPPAAADGVPRLVLAVAHPEVDPAMAWPGGGDRPAVAAAMQGASILNLARQDGRWIVVNGGFQGRRLDGATLCRVSGGDAPEAAGQGLLGIQGGGATPWGSLLLAEGDPAAWLARLRGLAPRFADARSFGWVVEIDPLDPASLPVKRRALGRIGAVAVAAALAGDGRAVVVLADGRPQGFVWRFVSSGPAAGPDALDAGTLSVARVEGEGLRWLPLPQGAAADPHRAAASAGATAFDTPCALALDTRRPRLLLACRGGEGRRPDALNPRAGVHPGHVVELTGDLAADRLAGRVLFLAGTAEEGGQYGRDQPTASLPRHPATLAVDGRGRLWIGTDRAGRPGAAADAVFACDLDGPGRAVVLPLYAAPRGAGIGGALPVPGDDALLALVRTPGAEPGAGFDRPATRWPAFDPGTPPRTTLLAITRGAGGAVGG